MMEERVRKLARKRRQPLRAAASALELAIAAPAGTGEVWCKRVNKETLKVRRALEEHVEDVEGRDGLAEQIATDRPRVINQMNRLIAEHGELRARTAYVLEALGRVPATPGDNDVAAVREAVMALIGLISRHRQKGADLIFEAYNVDIGGE